MFVESSVEQVTDILQNSKQVFAILDTNFPAEFDDISPDVLIGLLRLLGFAKVFDVSFGIDLLVEHLKNIYKTDLPEIILSSHCQASNLYLKKFYPEMQEYLAKVISPKIAMARMIRAEYGEDPKIVFIGSCISAKVESNEIDESLTYIELRKLFLMRNLNHISGQTSSLDSPLGKYDSVFSAMQESKLFQTDSDFFSSQAIGIKTIKNVCAEINSHSLKNAYIDLLICNNCNNQVGMTQGEKSFTNSSKIKTYYRQRKKIINEVEWLENQKKYKQILFKKNFQFPTAQIKTSSKTKINQILIDLGKRSESDYYNCKLCGYETCMDFAEAVSSTKASKEICIVYALKQMQESKFLLQDSENKIKSMQSALAHTEKLATMGQLSAGIAHELNNPLGVVIMYANILLEEAANGSQFKTDLKLIAEQATRCKGIVSGLLNFARKNQVRYSEVNVVELVKNSIDGSIIPENVKVEFVTNSRYPMASIDPDQITQVLNNMIKNAIDAMPQGGLLTIQIEEDKNKVIFNISDSGIGIEKENLNHIFEPFFTTKKSGHGTGLGLATSYGIVKMHKGEIKVETNTNERIGNTGTKFSVILPRMEMVETKY